MPHQTILAQIEDIGRIFFWLLVLLALVVLAFMGVVWLRRWLKAEDVPTGGIGFGLSELRAMHKRGQLTDEEFERARGKIASASKAMTANMPDPAGGRRAPGATGPNVLPRPDNLPPDEHAP